MSFILRFSIALSYTHFGLNLIMSYYNANLNQTSENFMAIQTLGYYSLPQIKSGYIGAILIIDKEGKPVEFRTTHSVKPTTVQVALYGDLLLNTINVELCGQPLFHALSHKPPILLVDNNALLPLATKISARMAHVRPFDHNVTSAQYKLTSSNNNPLAVTCPSYYNDKDRTSTIEDLTDFFKTVNLVEPFQRITVALTALANENPNFR